MNLLNTGKKLIKYKILVSILMIFVLLSPFVILFFFAPDIEFSVLNIEFIKLLILSAIQSLLSLSIALPLSFVAGVSLSSWKKNKYIESFLLLPTILPSLIMVLASLQIVSWFSTFPYGLWGVVLIHVLINIGLMSLIFSQVIKNKVGRFSEVALVDGVSEFDFVYKVVLPLIKKEIYTAGFTFFAFCFMSFSVPLLVGASSGATLEVLIYEKLRLNNNWSEALTIAFVQMLFLMFISFFIRTEKKERAADRPRLKIIKNKWGVLLALVASLVPVISLSSVFLNGWQQLIKVYSFSDILDLFMSSLTIGAFVGFMSFLFLSATCLCLKNNLFHRFMMGYVAPSGALTAFALILCFPNNQLWSYINISIGLFLVSQTVVYRLFIYYPLTSLFRQIQSCEVMGASSADVFKWIIFPQMKKHICIASGVAGFWAIGDFSLSSIIALNDFSLSLTIKTLINNYRLEAGTALSWVLIFCGSLLFFIFWSIGNVPNKKFKI